MSPGLKISLSWTLKTILKKEKKLPEFSPFSGLPSILSSIQVIGNTSLVVTSGHHIAELYDQFSEHILSTVAMDMVDLSFLKHVIHCLWGPRAFSSSSGPVLEGPRAQSLGLFSIFIYFQDFKQRQYAYDFQICLFPPQHFPQTPNSHIKTPVLHVLLAI